MAPRCGKKGCKGRNTLPLWLPLPRPCMPSMDMPGTPYYLPITPEMRLPPWVLPSCFTQPLCHCANENYCTTSNCKKSSECVKMHPMFCPYGTENEEPSDLSEQHQNSDDQGSSSNSDTHICVACGASNKQMLKKKKQLNQTNQHKGTHDTEQNIKKSNHSLTDSESDVPSQDSPETVLGKKQGCNNSSCQTLSNSPLTPPKKHGSVSPKRITSADSTSNYAEDSDNSSHRNNVSLNKSGPNRCGQQYENLLNDFDQQKPNSISNVMNKKSEETNKKATNNTFGCRSCSDAANMPPNELTTDSIHLDQLQDNLVNARKNQANKYSGCCLSGSQKSSKIDGEIDAMGKPITRKSRKQSECECYPNNGAGKGRSPRSRKLSECKCPSSKTQIKTECCPGRMHQKHSSQSRKMSGVYSFTKLAQKSSLRKVSECSCSSNKPQKVSSKSRKASESLISPPQASESRISPPKGSVPNASLPKLATTKSSKCVKDIKSLSETNVKQCGCQCKFPPAFEHLKCSGNLNEHCSCTNNGTTILESNSNNT